MRSVWLVGMIASLALALGTAQAAEKSKMVQGKVTDVAADSVTIMKGTESMTFAVDSGTKFVGKGLTTKSTAMEAKGQKLTLADSVAKDDMVSVTYTEMGGKMHASAVKITAKSLTAK